MCGGGGTGGLGDSERTKTIARDPESSVKQRNLDIEPSGVPHATLVWHGTVQGVGGERIRDLGLESEVASA